MFVQGSCEEGQGREGQPVLRKREGGCKRAGASNPGARPSLCGPHRPGRGRRDPWRELRGSSFSANESRAVRLGATVLESPD